VYFLGIEYTARADIRSEFEASLGKKLRSKIDVDTIEQAGYEVEKIKVCKACTRAHIKGCCEGYTRTGQSMATIVKNIAWYVEKAGTVPLIL
jgi:hypothetical protein